MLLIPNCKKTAILTAVTLLAITITSHASGLSPGLQKAAQFGAADSLAQVVVFLDDYPVAQGVFKLSQTAELNRGQRVKSIIRQLKSYSAPNERGILSYLSAHSVGDIKRHWITPAVTTTLPVRHLEALSELDGVKMVVENALLTYDPPVDISPVLSTSTASVSGELEVLGVPELWNRGLKGKGRLVCSFDTGVEQAHPALASKWRGNHAPLTASWFSKVAPDTLPYDPVGHGTHTMGIMVGATEADSFGVAPEAEWITAGVIDQGRTLSMTISDIIEAFQWSLNPDGDENTSDDVPDVILNSWGFPKGLFTPCDDTFWGMMDFVEAAGIVTIFSAGNEGPDPQTIRHPADRASTPINAFAVGAVDNSKLIAEFSSRGPSSCDTTRIKPEIVAPGVSIRSSTKGGGYVLMSGTSMAAPYVAGLVALIRQYNPEATVEEIKYAFIEAAEDLGAAGKDNAYGNGFIDASKVLDYIPQPASEEVEIVEYYISDDGIAYPGEDFGLQLQVSSSVPGLDFAYGTLAISGTDGLVTGNATAEFDFAAGGGYALNSTPFDIYFERDLYNGQPVFFKLVVSSVEANYLDTLDFEISAGISPKGTIATHDNESIKLSVSDFGQFGFAPNSIYNVQGEGLCLDGSDNLLYEAGLLLGLGSGQLASSIRDEQGLMKVSDFNPVRELTDATVGVDGGIHRTAVFTDARGDLNISVTQESVHFDTGDELGFLIMDYTLTNNSLDRMPDLHFGFFADLDVSSDDEVYLDDIRGIIYQTDGNGTWVGVVGIENVASFRSMTNGSTKTGFTDEQLSSMLSAGTDDVNDEISGDLMFMIASRPLLLDPRRSADVVLAIVMGHSLAELYENADKARAKYEFMATLTDEGDQAEPDDLKLYQNYPNPFNPSTTISFSVLEAGPVSLEIINILGQRVRTLYEGDLTVGLHRFDWDGTDRDGRRVASGVYFCRLHGDSSSQSRKMLLMK
jgi:hypothetical protein